MQPDLACFAGVYVYKSGVIRCYAHARSSATLLFDGVKMAAEGFVHREHVDLVLFEDSEQLLVADNLSLVVRVLKAVALDVVPQFLDNLRAGELHHMLVSKDQSYRGSA